MPFRKRVLRVVLFSTLIFLFFLLALEIVLRTTHLFGANVSWSENDPLLGWRTSPGAPYWFHKENDHPIQGRINQYGWRDVEWSLEKPEGTFRIAVLGDSFVEAYQVELEATCLKLAESRLHRETGVDVELMNFGRAGFSQTEELLVLENEVARFSPDMVLLFFLPENDIGDVAKETARDLRRPFFLLDPDGSLTLDTSFKDTREYTVRALLQSLKRRSALLSLVGQRLNLFQYQRFMAYRQAMEQKGGPPPEGLTQSASLCTEAPEERYAGNYRLNKILIRHMADFCRQRGILFMLVVLNSRAYLPEVEEELKAVDPTFDLFYFDDDMKRFADALNVPSIGLQRVFREDYQRNGVPLLWGHWNYEGHKVVADALVNELKPILQQRKTETSP